MLQPSLQNGWKPHLSLASGTSRACWKGQLAVQRVSCLTPNFLCCHIVQPRRECSVVSVVQKVFQQSPESGNDIENGTIHKVEVVLAVLRCARLSNIERAFIVTYKLFLFFIIEGFEASPRSSRKRRQLYQLLCALTPAEVAS